LYSLAIQLNIEYIVAIS